MHAIEERQEMLVQLQQRIEAWSTEKQQRNLSLLARRTKLPYSTLRRMLNGEAPLSFDKLLLVLEEICTHEEIQSFLEQFYPSFYRKLERYYARCREEKELIRTEQKDFLKEPLYYQVMGMACGEKGISYGEVKEELGNVGIDILEELVESQVLVATTNGRFKAGNMITTDIHTLLGMVKNSCEIFAKTKKAYVTSYLGCINGEALKRLNDILINAEKDVIALLDEADGKGDIPVSCSIVLGKLKESMERVS